MEDRDVMTVYDPETSTMVQSSARPYIPAHKTSTPMTYTDVVERRDLPVRQDEDTFTYRMWGVQKKFVIANRNAAQHLVRNALGGANAYVVDALLLMRPPWSRKCRYVVFLIVEAKMVGI
jgi:pyruvate dehydrogenase phosphatase